MRLDKSGVGASAVPTGLGSAEAPEPHSDAIPSAGGFCINIRWGHIDRMTRCRHGRVICSECGL